MGFSLLKNLGLETMAQNDKKKVFLQNVLLFISVKCGGPAKNGSTKAAF